MALHIGQVRNAHHACKVRIALEQLVSYHLISTLVKSVLLEASVSSRDYGNTLDFKPLGGCIRLDIIIANAGARDMETLGQLKGGGERVEGLVDGWTDAVRKTGSAWV